MLGDDGEMADVTPHRWGVSLTIPFSKTSLIPTTVDIVRRDDQLCPLLAYQSYWALLPVGRRAPLSPFFLQSPTSSSPLTDTQFIKRVRSLVRSALHRDPSTYAFRRGGTTALLLAGVPEATIALHGRWRSLAYRGYLDVQHSRRLRLAATAQLSLRTSQA
jgi:integrase